MTATTRAPRAREGEEIWETTTPGHVWVRKTDDRGRAKLERVGGKEGARLRIKTVDREIAQEEGGEQNAFESGLLKRVDSRAADEPETQASQALTTEELVIGFSKSGNAFQAYVNKLSEINVRRMYDMAEAVDATASQSAYLKQYIKDNYRVGGDTPTYKEMAERGDVAR